MARLARKRKSVTGQCTAGMEPESLTKDSLMISSTGFSLRTFGPHFFKGDGIPSSVLWIKARSYNRPRTLVEWGCSEKKGED